MVVPNPQATCSSVAMAMPKSSGFRNMSNYRAVNKLMEQMVTPMPCLEELDLLFEGVAAFCALDIIKRYDKHCYTYRPLSKMWSLSVGSVVVGRSVT